MKRIVFITTALISISFSCCTCFDEPKIHTNVSDEEITVYRKRSPITEPIITEPISRPVAILDIMKITTPELIDQMQIEQIQMRRDFPSIDYYEQTFFDKESVEMINMDIKDRNRHHCVISPKGNN